MRGESPIAVQDDEFAGILEWINEKRNKDAEHFERISKANQPARIQRLSLPVLVVLEMVGRDAGDPDAIPPD